MKCNQMALLVSMLLCVPYALEGASYWGRFTNLFSKESSDAVLAQLNDVLNKGDLKDLLSRHDFSLNPTLLKRLAKAGYTNLAQPVTAATIEDLAARLSRALAPAASALDRKNLALLTDVAKNLVQKYKHYFTLDRQIQLGAQGLAKLIALLKQRGIMQQNLQRLGTSVTSLAQQQALGNLSSGLAQIAQTNAAVKFGGITSQLFNAPIPQEVVQVPASYWQQYGQPVLGATTSALTGLGGLASSGIGYVGTQTGLTNYVSPQVMDLINSYPQMRNLLLGLALAGAGTYGSYQYYAARKPELSLSLVPVQKEGESTSNYIVRLKGVKNWLTSNRNISGTAHDVTLGEITQKTIDLLNAKINELELQELPWYKRLFWRPSALSSPVQTKPAQKPTIQTPSSSSSAPLGSVTSVPAPSAQSDSAGQAFAQSIKQIWQGFFGESSPQETHPSSAASSSVTSVPTPSAQLGSTGQQSAHQAQQMGQNLGSPSRQVDRSSGQVAQSQSKHQQKGKQLVGAGIAEIDE